MRSQKENSIESFRLLIAVLLAILVLPLTPHAAPLHGVVRKLSDSTTLSGAKVYYMIAGVRAESTMTDANGTYGLNNLPIGRNLIAVELAGYPKTYHIVGITVYDTGGRRFDFFLGNAGSISGVVRRSSDSLPMADAKVYLRRSPATNNPNLMTDHPLDSTVTNAQGVYTFGNVAPGEGYAIISIAPGFAATGNMHVYVPDGGATVADIYQMTLGKITVNVRKIPDSTAIANVLILLRQGNTDTSVVLDSGRTDAHGTYTFSDLTLSWGGSGIGTGTLYRVYAIANGYAPVKKTGMYMWDGNHLVADLTLTAVVSVALGPDLSAAGRFIATRTGAGWLIRLPASATNRTFTLHDARGVILQRIPLPAGTTELVIPRTATQSGVMMRLD